MARQNIIESKINDLVNELTLHYKIKKVILFGSYASNKQTRESDIDLAFFIEDIKESERISIMTKILLISAKYKIDIQPLVYLFSDYSIKNNDFIQTQIISKGKEIYKAA